MVNVLVIADEVASNLQERTLREIAPDLVLSAGDLPWDYLEWIASSVDVPMVFVPGNHDPEIKSARRGRFADYLEWGGMSEYPRPHGVINADQQVVEAAGLRIGGLGGCVKYNKGPHQYTQRQYSSRGQPAGAQGALGRARRRPPHARPTAGTGRRRGRATRRDRRAPPAP